MNMKSSFLIGLGLLAAGAVTGQSKNPKDKKEFAQVWCDAKGKALTAHYFFPSENGKFDFITVNDSKSYPEKNGTWSNGVLYRIGATKQEISLSMNDSSIAKNAANILKISDNVCKTHRDDIVLDDALTDRLRGDFTEMRRVFSAKSAAPKEDPVSARLIGRAIKASNHNLNGKDEFQVRCANGNLVSAEYFFAGVEGFAIEEDKAAYMVLGDSAQAFKENGVTTLAVSYVGPGWAIDQRIKITDPAIEKNAAYILETAKNTCRQHPDDVVFAHPMLTEMVVENFKNLRQVFATKPITLQK